MNVTSKSGSAISFKKTFHDVIMFLSVLALGYACIGLLSVAGGLSNEYKQMLRTSFEIDNRFKAGHYALIIKINKMITVASASIFFLLYSVYAQLPESRKLTLTLMCVALGLFLLSCVNVVG